MPEKFLPGALVEAKVIPADDARLAVPKAFLPGAILHFDFRWGELIVAPDKFQVNIRQAPYVRGCDLAVKALRDIPSEACVNAFGVNVESTFNVGEADRDAIGRRLAPPEAWGKWGRHVADTLESSDPLIHGGVVSVHMRAPFGEKLLSGWMDVTVGPSPQIAENRGVFLRSNHHHQFRPGSQHKPERLELLGALSERFDASVTSAENIFTDILESALT